MFHFNKLYQNIITNGLVHTLVLVKFNVLFVFVLSLSEIHSKGIAFATAEKSHLIRLIVTSRARTCVFEFCDKNRLAGPVMGECCTVGGLFLLQACRILLSTLYSM